MDTFENATPPQEQPEMVLAQCWECGEKKMCYEHLVCCTGTSTLARSVGKKLKVGSHDALFHKAMWQRASAT